MTDTASTASTASTPVDFEGEALRLRRHVGQVLEEARAGRPRPELAALLGYSSPIPLLHIERAKDNPTLERVARVAAACGGRLVVRFEPFEE